MKNLFLGLLTVFVATSASARESADGTQVTCTGDTKKSVPARANGGSNDIEKIQTVTMKVWGNEDVAMGTLELNANYTGSKKRNFSIEVSLGFTNGHTEKQIKLSTAIEGRRISTQNQLNNSAEVNLDIDGLSARCQLD